MATITETSSQAPQAGNILIVDTESMMCELLQFRFEKEGFRSTVVNDGHKALDLDLADYTLILVDLMDQPFNGLQFTDAVKHNPDTVGLPVIIMSAKASEDNIVDGLEAGADDYIAKPFSTRELMARVRSVIRRRNMMNARRLANIVRYQDLTLNMGAGTAFIDGMELSLSHTEFKLLALFLRHRNHFYDRAQIRAAIWDNDSDISDRAVDTGISRLRKKLYDYGRNLVNRKGFGYGFVE
ncbi:MAG: response regulator transcription factor [Firmicutes bacterium]|nr:response regulator transcription factor [Bacillota bacterium]MCM1401042.1 response regulator transcription factor [Bacteroides sp.]MCM1476961.1 response regulator transcription factor [Bacteroides sp.]